MKVEEHQTSSYRVDERRRVYTLTNNQGGPLEIEEVVQPRQGEEALGKVLSLGERENYLLTITNPAKLRLYKIDFATQNQIDLYKSEVDLDIESREGDDITCALYTFKTLEVNQVQDRHVELAIHAESRLQEMNNEEVEFTISVDQYGNLHVPPHLFVQ